MSSEATLTTEKLQTGQPAEHLLPAGAPGAFRSDSDKAVLVSFLLALGTIVVYVSSLRNGFVNLDDPLYILNNPAVRGGISKGGTLWALRTSAVDYWHPLTWLLHMATVQMFGLWPAGHHLVSLALHLLNVVLLFLLLRKATGALLRSAVAAATFAVFPLNVESVAWVAETKTLLCTCFLLLALWAYGCYARRPGVARYLLVLAMFALGLMAKPMLVTFPVALLLVDIWPLNRIDWPRTQRQTAGGSSLVKLVAEKIPLLALSVCSALSTIWSQRVAGAVVNHYAASWRAKQVIWSYAAYIFKGLWPAHLAAYYPYQGSYLSLIQVTAAAAFLIAVSALVWHFRQKKYLIAGWLWYLITMLPVIGIIQAGGQGMADRYAYIPFWGLFAATVWLTADLAKSLAAPRFVLATIAACTLAAYSFVTFAQVQVWHDSYALFLHATQVVPRNAFAEESLGELLMEQGRSQDALSHYQSAAEYMPGASIIHYNLATIFASRGQLGDAVRQYQVAIQAETTAPMLWTEYDNLGGVYVRMNRTDDALAAYSAAIRTEPDNAMAYKNRALVEYSSKNYAAARDDLSRAVELTPDPQTYYWLGRMFEDQGDTKQARENYQAAVRFDAHLADAQKRIDALSRK
jgi:tetratricopeptide (TPR) repeat protein